MNWLRQIKHLPHGLQTISEWLGEGSHVVDAQTAQIRADVCLKCPKNVKGLTLAKAVALAVKRHLQVKNAMNLRVKGEKQLGICEVCTCNLRLLIHLPQVKVQDEMTDEEKTEYPSFCWKLTNTP